MGSQVNLLVSYGHNLLLKIPKCIDSIVIKQGKLFIFTKEVHLTFLFNFLKNHIMTQYSVLVDITAVDNISKKDRFELFYFLRSVLFSSVLIVKLANNGFYPVTSVTSIYNGAGWLEREIWDMFGIIFSFHKDMRRILTDYGFQGFPMRKDFPLTGFVEIRYDDEMKRVVYDSLELAQEFRFFDFQSPWQIREFSGIQ